MAQKTAAPLTPDLLARKGKATAAAWRAESNANGPKVVALTTRTPTDARAEPAPTAAPETKGTARRQLLVLALVLVFGVAGGMAVFVAFSTPAADRTVSKPADPAPAAAPAALVADENALRVAAGPESPPPAEPAAPRTVEIPAAPLAAPPAEAPPVAAAIASPREVAALPATPEIPAPKAPAPTAPPVPAAAESPFTVQFASLKSRAAADREWARIKTRLAGLLAGFEPTVQRAAVARRGVFYRLRAGGFETRNAARALCKAVKAKRQSCLVIQR